MKKILLSLCLFVSLATYSQGLCSYSPCYPMRSTDKYQQADLLQRILNTYASTITPCTYSPCIPYKSLDDYQIGDLLDRILTSITNTSVTGWSLLGNTTATNNFLGTNNAADLVFKTHAIEKLRITSSGIFQPASTTATTAVPGSFYYDDVNDGFCVVTTPTNTNWSFTIKTPTVKLSGYIQDDGTVYKGAWWGMSTNHNLHFYTNGNGGGTPALSLISGTANAGGVIVNGGSGSYTTNATFKVNQSSLANAFQVRNSTDLTTWFNISNAGVTTVSAPLNVIGNTTFSGTVTHTGNINAIGSETLTGTLKLGNATLTGGNTGTVAVITDNYFTLNSTFNIQALSASTSYYWSTNMGLGVRTSVDQATLTIPYNCTLVGASICAWNAGGSTSQTNSTLNFRLNGVDNVISSAILWNTGAVPNSGVSINTTSLNININAGDRWENKLTLGALATPPNNGNVTVTYYFARR